MARTIIRDMVTRWKYVSDTKGLQEAENKLNRVGQRMRDTIGNSRYGKHLDRMNNSLGAFGRSFTGWQIAAGVALYQMASGIGQVLEQSTRATIAFEQHQVALTTMLKDAGAANQLLNDMRQMAKETPFQFSDLVEGGKRLLAFGVGLNDLLPTMQHLGDLAAAVGMDRLPNIIHAFGRIKTKGKATMEELNIMLENGVPILEALTEETGLMGDALFKGITNGLISFEKVDNAIKKMTTGEGRFAGMMIEQSKTLGGLLNQISDYLEDIGRGIGQSALPQLKELSRTVISLLSDNSNFLSTVGGDVLTFFANAAQGATRILKGMMPAIQGVVEALGGVGNLMRTLAILIQPLRLFMMADAILRIGTAFSAMDDKGRASIRVFKVLVGLVRIFALFMQLLIGLPYYVLEDFASYLEGKDSVFGMLERRFKESVGVISGLIKDLDSDLTDFLNKWTERLTFGIARNQYASIKQIEEGGAYAKQMASTPGHFKGKMEASDYYEFIKRMMNLQALNYSERIYPIPASSASPPITPVFNITNNNSISGAGSPDEIGKSVGQFTYDAAQSFIDFMKQNPRKTEH